MRSDKPFHLTFQLLNSKFSSKKAPPPFCLPSIFLQLHLFSHHCPGGCVKCANSTAKTQECLLEEEKLSGKTELLGNRVLYSKDFLFLLFFWVDFFFYSLVLLEISNQMIPAFATCSDYQRLLKILGYTLEQKCKEGFLPTARGQLGKAHPELSNSWQNICVGAFVILSPVWAGGREIPAELLPADSSGWDFHLDPASSSIKWKSITRTDYFTLHPEHQDGDIPTVWDSLDEQGSS